jgi:hypothetical protein
MNELDLQLESELRRWLAPVVAAPVPIRWKPIELRRTDYALGPGQFIPENPAAVPIELFS